MLILSRRSGESFIIGDNIRVTVLNARGNQVRLGIDAPKNTPVHREEIYQRMQQERAGHASSANSTATLPEDCLPED